MATTISSTTTGIVTKVGASASVNNQLGPYIYDTGKPFPYDNIDKLNTSYDNKTIPITSIATTVSQALNIGSNYGIITVANASNFPDGPGYLVFNYGNDKQVNYVPYLRKLNSTQLLLDYSFIFPNTVPSGADCSLSISSLLSNAPRIKGPFVPSDPVGSWSFYLTDSPSGRSYCQELILDSIAAGMNPNISITYPNAYGLGHWDAGTFNTSVSSFGKTEGIYRLNDIVGVFAENEDSEEKDARQGIL
ncbi:MAG: hypothetical protein KGO96_07765 [Elusimicrobia bacterium]|nr:hypothetical protein [Elusimicrobiota bacterium]